MAKIPSNHGKQWSNQDISQLKTLSKENSLLHSAIKDGKYKMLQDMAVKVLFGGLS